MPLDSPEAIGPLPSIDRSARALAATALVAAVLALVLPAFSQSHRTDAAVARAPVTIDGGADIASAQPAGGRGTPSYFGFLEFDWDRGVPGFDPWLAEGYRP
jgi:hypothetical protein